MKKGRAFWIFIAIAFFLPFTPGLVLACTVSSPTLNLGSYTSGQSSPINSTGSVIVNCANGLPYQIGLSNGLYYSGTRRLSNGGAYASYQLYKDSGYSAVWGDNQGVDTVSGTGTGANWNHDVYAGVPAYQTLPGGSYGDTVIVTVYY